MPSGDEFKLVSTSREPEMERPKPRGRKHWKEALQEEIDGYYEVMRRFASDNMDPAEIFMCLSGWTARMSEVKGQLWRSNDSVETSQIRIREVEPFIQECERQFKYHSRRFSGMEFDAKLQR